MTAKWVLGNPRNTPVAHPEQPIGTTNILVGPRNDDYCGRKAMNFGGSAPMETYF